ncbi:MAG: hypothetical protein R3233_05875 [Xanthomonadales bacterium]|nr:hypothetical protein [Xanthomonadales bacterium]
MAEYHILGCSAAMVSMMLECIHRLHPGGARVRIVTNADTSDELPLAVDGVETEVLPHERWAGRGGPEADTPYLCGVYRPDTKRAVAAFFSERYGIRPERYAKLLHPSAQVASTAGLGNGVDLGPNVVVAPYARIGNLVTLNRAVTIGHHTALADFVTVNPGAHVAGRCRIGEGVSIGMGSNVLDGVEIGARSVIGAGAVVTGDLPAAVVAVGVPARIVRSVE